MSLVVMKGAAMYPTTSPEPAENPAGVFSGSTGIVFGLATTSWIALLTISWVGIAWAVVSLVASLATWRSATEASRPAHAAAIGLSAVFVAVSVVAPGVRTVIWG